MPHTGTSVAISSIASPSDADAFRELSEEWISRHFELHEEDRDYLKDARHHIVDPGGDVLLARDAVTGAAVGCVALLAHPGAVFELGKLAVTADAQGRGIGRQLIAAAVDRARSLGGVRLFLGTNPKLGPAMHLYQEAGFVPATIDLPVTDPFGRASVLMELPGFPARHIHPAPA